MTDFDWSTTANTAKSIVSEGKKLSDEKSIAAIMAEPELSPEVKAALVTIAKLEDDPKGIRNEVDAEIAARKGDFHALDKHPGLAAKVMEIVEAASANVDKDNLSAGDKVKQEALYGALGTILGKTPSEAEAMVKNIATAKDQRDANEKFVDDNSLIPGLPTLGGKIIPRPGQDGSILNAALDEAAAHKGDYDKAVGSMKGLISKAVDTDIKAHLAPSQNTPAVTKSKESSKMIGGTV
ncbi:MAG: hypothetical protein ABSD75_24530 [Terriglobales bacterium]